MPLLKSACAALGGGEPGRVPRAAAASVRGPSLAASRGPEPACPALPLPGFLFCPSLAAVTAGWLKWPLTPGALGCSFPAHTEAWRSYYFFVQNGIFCLRQNWRGALWLSSEVCPIVPALPWAAGRCSQKAQVSGVRVRIL